MDKKLNINQIKEILRFGISRNKELYDKNGKTISFCLEGDSGIGKTSCCEQIAEELDMDYVKINGGQIYEPSEFTGYPIKEVLMKKNEEEIWINTDAITTFIAEGYIATPEIRMGFAVPDWVKGLTKPTILLIDDATRAPLPVMQAFNEVLDRQEFNTWKLPAGSTVIMTTNPDNGDFIVTTVDESSKTRRFMLDVRADVNCWAEWAEGKIDGRLINFLLKNPEIIEGVSNQETKDNNAKGNLRIWTYFFDLVGGIKNFGDKESWSLMFNLGQNNLPSEHLLLLKSFIDMKLDQLPTVDELLKMEPQEAIKKLKSCIGEGQNTRQDIRGILSKRIMNHIITHETKYSDDMINTFSEILSNEKIMSSELRYICAVKVSKLKIGSKVINGKSNPELVKLLLEK